MNKLGREIAIRRRRGIVQRPPGAFFSSPETLGPTRVVSVAANRPENNDRPR